MPAEATRVVLELLVELRPPLGLDHALENVANLALLVAGIVIARHRRPGDLPVVRHASAQQPTIRIHVLPVEAHGLFLGVRERIVEQLHRRFRRDGSFRRGGSFRRDGRARFCERRRPHPRDGGNRRADTHGTEKTTPVERVFRWFAFPGSNDGRWAWQSLHREQVTRKQDKELYAAQTLGSTIAMEPWPRQLWTVWRQQ